MRPQGRNRRSGLCQSGSSGLAPLIVRAEPVLRAGSDAADLSSLSEWYRLAAPLEEALIASGFAESNDSLAQTRSGRSNNQRHRPRKEKQTATVANRLLD